MIVGAAAVIERDGRFLVTRRIKGTHLEGLWEFPGGKCDDGCGDNSRHGGAFFALFYQGQQ